LVIYQPIVRLLLIFVFITIFNMVMLCFTLFLLVSMLLYPELLVVMVMVALFLLLMVMLPRTVRMASARSRTEYEEGMLKITDFLRNKANKYRCLIHSFS